MLTVGLLLLILIIGIIFYITDGDILYFLGIFMIAFGILVNCICGLYILDNYINYDIYYENKLAEKKMIEYRISQNEEIEGNELLYTQIIEFNNDLRLVKKWANNPWTNIFNNKKIASIDYIKGEWDD